MARQSVLQAVNDVSAQRVGVEGGDSLGFDFSLKKLDPQRYAGLHHPGDAYAYDIFTQVAQAMRDEPGVERVLAAGQSQSGIRLAEYVGSWLPAHPEAAGVIDGFLVHGNVPGAKAFAAASPVPVLQLLCGPVTLPRLWHI